ncbi:MFS transporter [Chthonobacter rhizosphaerae]|uniref:MFS transporter n=1 Tax=Chthonobacter rhizosphaerae TaxID=2735553 RepID=UPI0015EF4699|nr:MFS transporter [Chthonobacter rhizosphaerae]
MPETLRAGARWLIAGWLMTLSSSFGQTFFVSIFAGHLQASLALSAGAFGTLYSVATLASAATLMAVGKVTDRPRLRFVAIGMMAGLALTAGLMSVVSHPAMLVVLLFGLRFFGQGMMSHVAMTGMGRWFPKARGKAVSLAALGHPSGEAVFPLIAVTLIGALGWRQTWLAGAAFLALVAIPAMAVLLAREPSDDRTGAGPAGGDPLEDDRRHWTRAEVLRDGLFYALQPGVLAPPFVLTAVFFTQVPMMAEKGWPLTWFAGAFPVYAATTVLTSLVAGVVIDRVGARRILPVYLLPMGMAAVLIGVAEDPVLIPVALGLAGMTAGGANTLLGALWAELYGTRHLGAVRGLATSGLVFASALSPALVGLLADAGIPVTTTLMALGGYSVAAAGLMGVVAVRVGRRRVA